jgi:FkbM family methyltransferase
MASETAKRALKSLRASQPFNWITTTSARLLFSGAGGAPEVVVKHLHRVGTVRCALSNGKALRLWSRGDDWVSNQLFWRGLRGYEPGSAEVFFRLAASAPVTLDVGSYVGFYTLLAAHANPQGRVYAFEPLPPIFERLTKNVALNRVANVQCIPCAVSDKDGSADFHHQATGLPTSSSLSHGFMASSIQHATEWVLQRGPLTKTTVSTVTLDRFAEENRLGPVGLIKVDVEGVEPDVLRGMAGILQRDHPALLCEVLPGAGTGGPLEAILSPLGYRFYHLTPGGPVEKPSIEGHPEWLNYLFTTAEPNRLAELLASGAPVVGASGPPV